MKFIVKTLENKEVIEHEFNSVSKSLIYSGKLDEKGFKDYNELKGGYQEKTYYVYMKP